MKLDEERSRKVGKKRKKKRQNVWKKIGIIAAGIVCIVLTFAVIYFITEKKENGTDAPEAKVTLEERMDAPYELWLAASVVTGLASDQIDFEIGDLYTASETKVEDKLASQGVYLEFTTGEETRCVRSVPLEAERTDEGTMDVYSDYIGYATFEVGPAESVPEGFQKQELSDEKLNKLIEQLVQVYLSYH